MEDDHVDRPGVEERQRLKLTGTNSSIGLIVLITYIHREIRWSDQRSRMSGPYGPMLREGAGKPATRSRACGLRPTVVLTHACSALRAALRGCGASAPTVGRPCEASLRKAPRSKNVQGTYKTSETAQRKQHVGSPICYSLSAIRSKSFSI